MRNTTKWTKAQLRTIWKLEFKTPFPLVAFNGVSEVWKIGMIIKLSGWTPEEIDAYGAEIWNSRNKGK